MVGAGRGQQNRAGVGEGVADVELRRGPHRTHLKRRAGIDPDGARQIHDVVGGGQNKARSGVDYQRRRDRALEGI